MVSVWELVQAIRSVNHIIHEKRWVWADAWPQRSVSLGADSTVPLFSGSCGSSWSLYLRPCGVPAVGLDVGSEIEYCLAAFPRPAHPASAQACLDQGLARRFDRTASDGPSLAPEICIAHSVLVPVEEGPLGLEFVLPALGKPALALVVIH